MRATARGPRAWYPEPGLSVLKLIYLDIDGVLHHEELHSSFRRRAGHPPSGLHRHRHFEWAHHFERLLQPHPDVALVISSQWSVHPGMPRTWRRLPKELRARVIGSTADRIGRLSPKPVRRFCALPRGEQVWADVGARQPRNWVALDDNVHGWPDDAVAHLIPCDGDVGMSSPVTQSLLCATLEAWVSPP